eukprot:5089243-Prymnesium_polylepis.1
MTHEFDDVIFSVQSAPSDVHVTNSQLSNGRRLYFARPHNSTRIKIDTASALRTACPEAPTSR